uniref:Tripartite motif-containing protein 16-like n=1 Tax=Amphiprion percula TaxID=161767 RepID=A0A3P8TVE1_AMPPE
MLSAEDQRNQSDSEKLSCSICLDLLKDPVSTSCGHNYCMDCIKTHWDAEDGKRIYSCPQCRKTFTPRPVLQKNVLSADLVEELKKTRLQAAAAEDDDDLSVKSCLFCLVSFCEQHLQPHYQSPAFKKHQLVEPSKNLQENICSRHDEVMKIFCLTDQQLICSLCSLDEHKGHESISAAAERKKKQKELEVSRLNVQQRIQDRQKDVKMLQQELEDIRVSADRTVEDNEKMFSEMIQLIHNRQRDVEQQIRSQQKTEESRVKELQEKLEQEIRDLKRKDAELKQLSDTPDHSQFLHNYPSVSALSESKPSSMDVLLSEPQPKTRDGFLKYSREITLDPNTAFRYLLLSGGNRKVTVMTENQSYPDHPDRFTDYWQVLSKESLTGRCYWEVEWRGRVGVSVAKKNICRKADSNESAFGYNNKSWSLICSTNRYTFRYNSTETPVSGPQSSRIGVYLDHRAGILSFYSVSKTMTLLHRVQTTFTEPLHAGVWLPYGDGNTAEFLKVKQ